ncbi:hypothetical protein [Stenotrophomonas sp.]|uniref:hypothetical protein n=1 Tax=Stenotrophomonas sp. TaxID=69392 RepID=UPI00289DF43B|nr:hypothetical protein [Stenotrophomonas sp.]
MKASVLWFSLVMPAQVAFSAEAEVANPPSGIDICSISNKDQGKEFVLDGVLKSEPMHGTFLGSKGCPYQLGVRISYDNRVTSVQQFVDETDAKRMEFAKQGKIDMTWKAYQGRFSGVVEVSESGRLGFNVTGVYEYKEVKL